jgi:hypothetical protein
MPASPRIGGVLCIHNIIHIHQREPLDRQQRFQLSDRVPQFFLGPDILPFDKHQRLFHFIEGIVDHVCNDLRTPVCHRVEVEGAYGRNRFLGCGTCLL